MQRKANGRAHVDLFLYQVLMVSELSLSVLPTVCVGLRKNCSVPHKSRAVYTKRCTSAFWGADHVQELPALLPQLSVTALAMQSKQSLKHLKQRPTKKTISLFYNLLLWVNIHPLKFSCAIDFSFLHAKSIWHCSIIFSGRARLYLQLHLSRNGRSFQNA